MPATHSFDLFSTPNGLQWSRVKGNDENLFPFGCYFDKGEMSDAFLNRINQDIIPFLPIIERSVCETFGLVASEINYKGWIYNDKDDSPGTISQLNEIQSLCIDYILRWGSDEFCFYLDIDITAEPNWGTQLSLYADCNTRKDIEAEAEFPVWLVGFEPVYEPIDNEISIEKLQSVIDFILAELQRCKTLNRQGKIK